MGKDSPWAPEKAKDGAELKFEYREQAIDYMGDLMRLNMFHRAKKIPVAEKEKKKKKDETDNEEEKEKKGKADDKKDKKKKRKGGRSGWKCTWTKSSWTTTTLTSGFMTQRLGTIT